MENSQISPTYFNVTFNPDDRSIRYNLDLSSEIAANITAHVQIYAYGFVIIDRNVDMCTLGWKQFCPMYPGSMQIDSIEYISETYTRQIPGIAYLVPDIDAVVKVDVYDTTTGARLSCLQSSFSNKKTVAQVGIKWATACIAGLGLLIAAILSTFGNSNAASHVSTNVVSLFLYFQSVVIVSMQSVERVPPIASSWAENLAWSMGLIRVEFMQKIFRWYVQSTGGTPDTFFKGTSRQILVQRAMGILKGMHDFAVNDGKILPGHKRSLDFSLNSNQNLIVLRGIKRIGFNSHIEPSSIVVTGFTFFVVVGFLMVVILVFIKQVVEILVRFKKVNPNTMNHFRVSFRTILKGSLLRYLSIGFAQLVIFSLWEFTVVDSPAVVVLAVLCLLMSVGIIAYSIWSTWRIGQKSKRKYNNPAAVLYGDTKVLQKLGFCYTMFHAEKYWFGAVIVCYNFVKGVFIALCQGSGKVSTIVLFVVDLGFMIYLFILKPYLNKFTNILNYCVAIVITVNSFLYIFFSDVFGQPAQVASIMGWVFFILNAAFSLLLLIMIFVFVAYAILSKNPDARFAPAKDDRTSFQRKSSLKHKASEKNVNNLTQSKNELLALGVAAQDHQENWEDEMYKLTNLQHSGSSRSERLAGSLPPSPNVDNDDFEFKLHDEVSSEKEFTPNKTVGEKLKDKLQRGLSIKSQSANKNSDTHVQRMSDTLKEDDALTHKHKASVMSESAFSNYSTTNPTNPEGFV